MRKYKYVPQLDVNGYFTGLSIADESPIHPGTYELAQGAIDVPHPPREPEPYEAIYWTGEDWSYKPDYTGVALFDTKTGALIEKQNIKRGQSLADLNATLKQPQYGQRWNPTKERWEWTLTQLKEFKLAELSALRWDVQCAGVKVGSIEFASSPEDTVRLKNAIEDARLIDEDTLTFKAKSGFIEIDVSELQEVYKKIVKRTQLCFKNEKALTEQIHSLGTAEDVEAFNIKSGWPD